MRMVSDGKSRLERRVPARRYLALLARLTKLPIAFLTALSAATGHILFRRGFDPGCLAVFLCVFILAMGACALNEVQDREIDGRMKRTRRRPLPSGEMRPGPALSLALSLIAAGLLSLAMMHNVAASAVGFGAVLWYNAFYTYVKRVWAIAVLPGALIGAAPPVLGWAAAGGSLLDPHIFALAFFFFLWQMPHFWLLFLEHRAEYAGAGLPAMPGSLDARRFAGLIFLWMSATAASGLLMAWYRLTISPWVNLCLAVAGLWLVGEATRLLTTQLSSGCCARLFRTINVYALLVMTLLAIDTML